MKKVSFQVLRRELSKWLDAAANGETIVITRHEKPVAKLVGALGDDVQIGAAFGRGSLSALFLRKTGGQFLTALREDRHGEAR